MNQENELRRSRVKRKRRRAKKTLMQSLLVCFLILFGGVMYSQFGKQEEVATKPVENNSSNKQNKTPENTLTEEEIKRPKETIPVGEVQEQVDKAQIKISAAGDFTLGTDETFQYSGSFVDEATKNDLSYFTKGLDIFRKDDLTTVNLETTLTNATEKANKKFRFKGDPSYAKILTLGGIDAVNLANNHIYDYLQKGYDDTIATLKQYSVGYFGYDHVYLKEINGVKIGAIGFEGWDDTKELRNKVEANIKLLRDRGAQIVLVHYHWGIERQYVPNEVQRSLAKFTIDSGADLIIGHHPHVIQGIEEYNGRFIVYSLGNFMFGGNRNPSDKDTYVFQQTFYLENGKVTDKKEINIVPFSISSVTDRNNYQPTALKGAELERVMQKIVHSSNQIAGSEWLVYDMKADE